MSSKYGYGDQNRYARQHKPTTVNPAPLTPCPIGHPDGPRGGNHHQSGFPRPQRNSGLYPIDDHEKDQHDDMP